MKNKVSADETLKITRLSWAGIQLEKNGSVLVIDGFENTAPVHSFLGSPLTQIWPIRVPNNKGNALVTHIHPDHFDIEMLIRLFKSNGRIYGPAAVVAVAIENGLTAVTAYPGKSFKIGPFEAIAVHAMDWRGDEQVSWVIRSGDFTIFHGGDTIWHGYWWQIARSFGPFDIVFLPINGVIVKHPDFEPSGLPATLTPAQAAIAARLLKAKCLCPIHYQTFHNPPLYNEEASVLQTLNDAGREEHVNVKVLHPGESIVLEDSK